MDSSYSPSNVVGYKDSLYDYQIKLPLNYPPSFTPSSPNDHFHEQTASLGKIIELPSQAIVNAASISILNDLKTIVLTPLEFHSTGLEFKFQNLIFQIPHPIISTNCVTFQYVNDHIIIDMVDENYLFITLKISVDSFVQNQKLSLTNFDQWGHISVPYSFELRSPPFFMKYLDSLNLIVSLKDGGLLHLSRNDVLDDFTVCNFQEQTNLLPFLGFFSSGGKKTKEIVLDGVSSNSIVDALKIDDLVITLSVNKVIKFWNLNDHQFLKSISLAEDDTWLTTVPCKYFQIYQGENSKILTLFVNTKAGDSTKSMFAFKSFEIIGSSLTELTEFSFQPELPNTLLYSKESFYHNSNFQNTIWFIQDYDIQVSNGNEIKYYILWKSNTSSILVNYAISLTTGSITSVNISHPDDFEIEEDIAAYHESEYYFDKIFNSGNYDELIVSTSIKVLSQHWKTTTKENDDLREYVKSVIKSDKSGNPKINWFKLQSLCDEYKKLSQEALSLTLLSNQKILTTQVNGYGIFRGSNYFESFINQKLTTPDGELMTLFTKFRNILSNKSYHKLHDELLEKTRGISADDVTSLFTKYIEGKISSEDIKSILDELDQIPGVVDLIKAIIGKNGFELVASDNISKPLGIFNKVSTIVIFQDILEVHQNLLLDLMILFLLCESNDEIVNLANDVISSLSRYHALEIVFGTTLHNGKVEDKAIGKLENSIFWSSVVDTNSQLNKFIKNTQLNEAFDYLYSNVLPSDYLIDVVIELINLNEGFYLQKKFLSILNGGSNIDNFLIGIIHLITNDNDAFYKVFENYEIFTNISQNKLKNLNKDTNLNQFLDILFTQSSKSQYYHALSKLTQSQIKLNNKSVELEDQFIKTAADFEILAIDNETTSDLKEEYYLDLFNLALSISNYELVIKSLTNLNKSGNFKDLFGKFITKIIIQSKIDLIFVSDKTSIFKQHYSLVDSIISQVADASSLWASLKIYQYLYSWRLFGF
ncbi:Subunit of the nuclear pore complex (NPC), putative [Candida maltosa Xu316]|uniref:Subunit of the nuclear pore complex (NPC), putative n=1 Tax=Candida maltosa (strain Xu316) TaxID=1245528 RepID=M3HLJ9_CANMX|nr:Subunit of the nuclear pore complex (NPC), putative [Candida maltosa Xu316]